MFIIKFIINFKAYPHREEVFIHCWHPHGTIPEEKGIKQSDGTFRFELNISNIPDLQQIQFKYYFPKEAADKQWEPDAYTRRIPLKTEGEFWTFDYSRRCILVSPNPGVHVSKVKFHLVTEKRFKNGSLLIWNHQESQLFPEIARNEATRTSDFEVTLADWMKGGFLFKFKDNQQAVEPEEANKVWVPSDGGKVWLKSGQFTVSQNPIKLNPLTVQVIHPKKPIPSLKVVDHTGDYDEEIEVFQEQEVLDEYFIKTRFKINVYNDVPYFLWTNLDGENYKRSLEIAYGILPASFTTITGQNEWVDDNISRSVAVNLVIHPNPRSKFKESLKLQLSIADQPPYQPPLETTLQNDQTSLAKFNVFPKTAHFVKLMSQNEIAEYREDATPGYQFKRLINIENKPEVTLHIVDGILGLSENGNINFEDVDEIQMRPTLMAAAYHPDIVTAGVFGRGEMPLGTVKAGNDVWAVLKAPHALQVEMIVLDESSPIGGMRIIKATYSMKLTHDLRYWWLKVSQSDLPEGSLYRFVLYQEPGKKLEVLDSASRGVYNPTGGGFKESLAIENDQGKEAAWSTVVYLDSIQAHYSNSSWEQMGWEYMIISQIHASRLSYQLRNKIPFDGLQDELDPGGYLDRLGSTALLLMPVEEFSGRNSWGYNTSNFFAMEYSFGGPNEMAAFVRKAHDKGKAVLLDLVYNHMNESPLQIIAKDFYIEGHAWGERVNFANPAALEYFRQALVYTWYVFKIDGFRWDSTTTIIPNNGGKEFLRELHRSLWKAATALGQSKKPYCMAEHWESEWQYSNIFSDPLFDGQWNFNLAGALKDSAEMGGCDCATVLLEKMNSPFNEEGYPFHVSVPFVETHDYCSGQDPWKMRVTVRPPWGFGYKMAKSALATVLLCKGIPLIFMGQEYGETRLFPMEFPDIEDETRYIRPELSQGEGDTARIFKWANDLMALRRNSDNYLQGDHWQEVHWGHRTIAFKRGWGKIFAIVTYGTPDTVQNLGWLGLTPGERYKEIYNSTWQQYRVENEPEVSNGGYEAALYADNYINLPYVGCIVLEKY